VVDEVVGRRPTGADPIEPVQLIDVRGRRVAVAQAGAPDGAPAFWFHATPGSRLAAPPVRAAAEQSGVRLLLTDRPGFGQSDPQRNRDLSGWADDVAAIADHLGVERFAAVGSSGGGPHALACAHRLEDRVTVVGLLGTLGPLPPGRLPRSMKVGNRVLFGLARRWPGLFRIVNRMLTAPFIVTINDDQRAERVMTRVLSRLSEAERSLVGTPEARSNFVAMLREAIRQGSAPITEELLMLTRPWGFEPAGVAAPVHLWHGVDDASVPVAVARDLAETIPGCRTHWLDGGHAAWLLHLDEVMGALRST
jgi:pimeloyl-ACP methyl ester carboxylesterase